MNRSNRSLEDFGHGTSTVRVGMSYKVRTHTVKRKKLLNIKDFGKTRSKHREWTENETGTENLESPLPTGVVLPTDLDNSPENGKEVFEGMGKREKITKILVVRIEPGYLQVFSYRSRTLKVHREILEIFSLTFKERGKDRTEGRLKVIKT